MRAQPPASTLTALAILGFSFLLAGCGDSRPSPEERARDKAAQESAAAAAQREIDDYQARLDQVTQQSTRAALASSPQPSNAMSVQREQDASKVTPIPSPSAPEATDSRPKLWQGARYSMSVPEVQAAVPGSRPSTDYDPLVNGARALLSLANVELFGRHFTAKFYFQNDRLLQVMLSMTPPPAAREGKSTFEDVRQGLRAKYGMEIDGRGLKNSVGTVAHPTWMSGETNIELMYLAIGEHFADLNIVYQVRISREAAKL